MLNRVCPICHKLTLKYDDGYVFCDDCELYRKPLGLKNSALLWTGDKTWWWRAPIPAYFFILLIQNLSNYSFALNRTANFFSYFDLVMHELGHIIFSLFGEFITIAGGSLFQCMVPLLWMIGLIQKKWYFAASMCWCWLGVNLFDVAAYAADARARLFPLVSFGGIGDNSDEGYDRAHDWYQLLSRTHHLNWDLGIAFGLRVAGVLCFIVGFVLGAILIWHMMAGTYKKARIPVEN